MGLIGALSGAFLSLVLLLAGCAAPSSAPARFAEGNGTLIVEAVGFRTDRGRALASLFANAEGFPEATGEGIRVEDAPIFDGRAQIVFMAVAWGEYAVSVLHDEDGDGRMRRNWMGMAREGHGVSNSPQSRFGPPPFDRASFVLLAPQRSIPVIIRYAEKRGPASRRP